MLKRTHLCTYFTVLCIWAGSFTWLYSTRQSREQITQFNEHPAGLVCTTTKLYIRYRHTYVLLASMFPSHNYDYKQSTPVTLVIMYSRNESHVPMDHPVIMSAEELGGSRKWPVLRTFNDCVGMWSKNAHVKG